MKIGIVGSRNVKHLSVRLMAEYLPENCSKIISGGAVGVDSYAKELARVLALEFEEILPDYDFFGKIAPIVRNTTIVKKSDQVIAFWDYKSKGTAHTINQCVKLSVPVKIIAIQDIMEE